MSTARVLRFTVPVDDAVHTLPIGSGPILHVDCRNPRYVEFWKTVHDGSTTDRHFTVVGTGHQLPAHGTAIGTALSPAAPGIPGAGHRGLGTHTYGELVWHLIEVPTAGTPQQGTDPVLTRLAAEATRSTR